MPCQQRKPENKVDKTGTNRNAGKEERTGKVYGQVDGQVVYGQVYNEIINGLFRIAARSWIKRHTMHIQR